MPNKLDEMQKEAFTPKTTGDKLLAMQRINPVKDIAIDEGQYNLGYDKLNSYDTGLTTGVDQSENRAYNQSTGDKWLNGAVKGLYTGLQSAADPFILLTYGLLEAGSKGMGRYIKDGVNIQNEGFEFADIFNNTISKSLDSTGEYLKEEFPNYYTKHEQEASIFENLGTANFWADKFLNGVGFMAGAYLSGLGATKLLSSTKAAEKLASQIISRDSKFMTEAVDALASNPNTLRGISSQSLEKAIHYGLTSGIAGFGETSFEARGVIKQVKDKLVEKALAENGVASYEDLSNEIKADIESNANMAGNINFAINLPIIMGANALTIGKLMKGSNTSTLAVGNLTDKLNRVIFGTEQASLKKLSSIEKGLKYAEPILSEGTQEQLQQVAQTGVESYFTKETPDGTQKINDIIEATIAGFKEAYGTKEGWEQFVIGSILGGTVGGISTRGEIKNEDIALQALIDNYNNNDINKILKESANTQFQLSDEMDAANRKGDKKTFLDKKQEMAADYILSRLKIGASDRLYDDVDRMNKLDNEAFKIVAGLPNDIPSSEVEKLKNKNTSELRRQIKEYSQQYVGIQSEFSDRSQEEKDVFFKLSTKVLDSKDRIQELNNEFLKQTGLNYESFREAINDNLKGTKERENKIKQIKSLLTKQRASNNGEQNEKLYKEYLRLINENKYAQRLTKADLNNQIDNTHKEIFNEKLVDRLNSNKDLTDNDLNKIVDIYNDLGNLIYDKDLALETYNHLIDKKNGIRQIIKLNRRKIQNSPISEENKSNLDTLQNQAEQSGNNDLAEDIKNEKEGIDIAKQNEKKEAESLIIQQTENPFIPQEETPFDLPEGVTTSNPFGEISSPTEEDLKSTTNNKTTAIIASELTPDIPTNGNPNSIYRGERTSDKKIDINTAAGNQSTGFGERDSNGKIIKNEKQVDYFNFITTPSSWDIKDLQDGRYYFKIEQNDPDGFNAIPERELEFNRLLPILAKKLNLSEEFIKAVGYTPLKAVLYKDGQSTKLETILHITDYVHESTMGLEGLITEELTLDEIKIDLMLQSLKTRLQVLSLTKEDKPAFVQIKDLSLGHLNTIELNGNPVEYHVATQLNKKNANDVELFISNMPDGTLEGTDLKAETIGQVNTIIDAPLSRKALLPLKTRTLNGQEINTVWESIKRLTLRNEKAIQQQLISVINSLIYVDKILGIPDEITEKSIYINNGKVYFGEHSSKLYDIEDGALYEQFKKFVQTNYYVQVNRNLLKANKPYTRVVYNGDNLIKQQFPSYKDYLINTSGFSDIDTESILSTDITDEDNKFLQPNVYFDNNVVSEIPNYKVEDKQLAENKLEPTILISTTSRKEYENKEVDVKKENEAKKKFGLTIDNNDAAVFRKSDKTSYKQIDVNKEFNWFKKNISDSISVKTFEGLFHAGQSNIHGYFQKALVAISNVAEEGTTYHEAFHAIFRSFLTKEERTKIYAEAREKYGYNNSNLQLEEYLAEEFREYVLSEGTTEFKGKNKQNFFEKIWELIKNLIFNNISVDSLFKRINTGYYKHSSPIERNLEEFTSTAYRQKPDELTELQVNDTLNVLDLYMRNYLVTNNITLFQMIKSGNVVMNEVYKKFYQTLSDKRKEMEDEGYTDTEMYNLYSQFDKTDVRYKIEQLHLNHLKKFDIEASFNEELENEEVVGEQITENDYFAFKDSVEISAKDNTKANIKFFLATIPSFSNKENSFGLPIVSDWNITYNFLQKRLAGFTDYDDMMHRLSILKTRRPEIEYIYNILEKAPESFCSQFYNTFNQTKNSFYTTLVDEDNIYEVQANSSTITENIIDEWKSNFRTKSFVTEDGEGNYIIDKKELKKIITNANKILKSSKELSNELLDELSKLGVNLTQDFKDNIQKAEIGDKKRDLERSEIYNKIAFIYKTLNNQIKEELPIEEFDNKLTGDLKTLADYESEYRDDLEEDVHLNPEGNPQYGYTLPSRMSDIINWARNGNLAFFRNLQQKDYSKDSKWIQQILQGVKPDLIINEGIREKEVGSEGVVNKDLSFADLLSSAFNPILSGVKGVRTDTIFKTKIRGIQAADKNTSFTVGGFNALLTAKESLVEYKDGRFQLIDKNAEKEVIKTFYQYFQTELFRILKSKIQVGVINPNSPFYAFLKEQYGEVFNENLDKQILSQDKLIIPYHIDNGGSPNGLALKWTLFDNILSSEVKDYFNSIGHQGNILLNDEIQAKIEEDILKYISDKVLETRASFVENNIIIEGKDGYESNGIDIDILDKYGESNTPIESSIYHAIINDLQGKIEITKLFLGDLAFYKDVVKRVPSIQAAGKSARSDTKMNNYIQNTIYNSNKTKGWNVDGKMNVVIAGDYIVSSDNNENIKTFVDIAKDIFKNAGFTEVEVSEIISKYNSTNRTDAQFWSNIETFKESNERIGEWSKERDIIYNKIINNERITKQDYKNLLMLKPQKPVIVGKWENDDNSLDPAAYLKNSIAPPLIPQFVKGTVLENMSDLMYKNKIHYIGVISGSKASTIGLSSIFDYNGNINPELDLSTKVNKINWNSFRQQLEIPDKEQIKILQPTQSRKLLFSNLFLDGKPIDNKKVVQFFGNKITIQKAWEIFNSAHNHIGLLERNRIIEELGVEVIDDRYRIVKPSLLIDKLKKDLLEDLPDNIIDLIQVTTDSEGKEKLLIPFDSTPLRQKVENKLNNLITSSIVKQKMNGSMNALMSDAGVYSKEKDNIHRSNELKAELTESGGLILEVILPHHFKEVYGENLTVDEIDPKLLNMIGIRIPTQGLNSIHRLKVVGFSPKEVGDIIILPSVITTISGADFDIDKLNILKYNYKIDEEGEINSLEPNFESPTKENYEDMILELYHGILGVPQTFAQQITPNSADMILNIRNTISKNIMTEEEWNKKFEEQKNGKIKAKQVSYTNYIEFLENLKTQIVFLSGKAGVGQTAVHNASHPLFQVAGIYLNEEETKRLNFDFNKDKQGFASFSGIKSVDNNLISETLSQLLTAFVDLAKDPFIYDLNANTFTNNTIFMLVRLGASPDWIFRFITQPSIIKYTKDTFNNEGVVIQKNDKLYKQKDQLLNDTLNFYYNKLSSESKKKIENKDYPKKYSISELDRFQRINQDINNFNELNQKYSEYEIETFLIAQYNLLNDFTNYQEISKDLQKVIRAISSDTKGAYKELYLAQQHMDNVENVQKNNKFIGVDRLFENNGASTFVAGYTQLGTQLALDLFSEDILYTQHPKFKQILKDLLTNKYETENQITKEKIVRKLTNQLLFNLTITGINKINPNAVKNIFNTLAREVLAIKNDNTDELNKNLLFSLLSVKLSNNKHSLDIIQFKNKPSDKEVRNLISSSWQELLDNENTRQIGKKLVLYSLYQSGMNNSGISFFNSIPSQVYLSIVKDNLPYDKLDNISELDIQNIERDIIANNINDNILVPILSRNSKKISNKDILALGGKLLSKESKLFNNKFVKEALKSPTGKRYGWKLYQRLGLDTNGDAIFARINVKGEGYKFTEVGLTNESILPKNNYLKSIEYRAELLNLLDINNSLLDAESEILNDESEPPQLQKEPCKI